MLAALLIFSGTYLVLAIGRLPFYRVDRTGAAIIGATLMIAFQVVTPEEAYRPRHHPAAVRNYDCGGEPSPGRLCPQGAEGLADLRGF
jgi:hypothetical protein